jgi:hypothetical protein
MADRDGADLAGVGAAEHVLTDVTRACAWNRAEPR